MKETKSLSKGKVQMNVVTRDDYNKRGASIPNVAFDIYRHLSEFQDTLYCIQKIQPSYGNTSMDVLKEFIEEYGEQYFVIVQSDFLLKHSSNYNKINMDNIGMMTISLSTQKSYLLEAGFENILFNRKCSNIYTNGNIFVYPNERVKQFLQDNCGDIESGKIIGKIISNTNKEGE